MDMLRSINIVIIIIKLQSMFNSQEVCIFYFDHKWKFEKYIHCCHAIKVGAVMVKPNTFFIICLQWPFLDEKLAH